MALHHYPGRMLLATAISSVLLLASSAGVAIYLNSQQTQTAENLDEDIGSRRAAANLEVTLTDLVALHKSGTQDVGPLHEQVQAHLAKIDSLANKQKEKQLAARVTDSFNAYLALWLSQTDPMNADKAVAHLTADTIPACEKLREYNANQIEASGAEHLKKLRLVIWGFVAVGILGSAAGLLLGYGLARGLRRAVDSFLVHVQGASDLLGQELATVEWQRNGQPVGDGVEDLALRVEKVVQQLQQREREVRRSERLAAVGQLAAGVAHEIRNPLTSVQLLVQTARKDPTAEGLTPNDLALIDDELGRIERSLKTFIDYARPPKLERLRCDLTAVIESALKLIHGRALQQGVEARFTPPAGSLTLDADAGQLRQVIVNLLLNSLDAMPSGGRLEIIAQREGSIITVEIDDTGNGISPAIAPRLFEPFATGKETGLGLGLVVSKRIVEDHGGTLRGFNRPEGGATFVARLPCAA